MHVLQSSVYTLHSPIDLQHCSGAVALEMFFFFNYHSSPYLQISEALSITLLLSVFQYCISFLQGMAFGLETSQSIHLMMSQMRMAIFCLQFLLVSICS